MKYLIIVVALFASCKTTRNVQKFSKQVDSTGFFKRDSISIRHVDSVNVEKDKKIQHEEVNNDYEEWIIIEEDSVKKKTTIHIRDKGRTSSKVVTVSKDSTHVKKSDSNSVNIVTKTLVKTDIQGKNLNVKKTQGGLWINLGILLFILLMLCLGYQKYKRKFIGL
jgi:hypothetical protein